MARENKFLSEINKSLPTTTATDDIVEDLYNYEEHNNRPKSDDTAKTVKNEKEKRIDANNQKKVSKSDTKKVGRPKERETDEIYNQIHINIPNSLKTEMQKAVVCRKTNMNTYIVSLIKKDLKDNEKEYDNIMKLLKRFE